MLLGLCSQVKLHGSPTHVPEMREDEGRQPPAPRRVNEDRPDTGTHADVPWTLLVRVDGFDIELPIAWQDLCAGIGVVEAKGGTWSRVTATWLIA
jgi:hypothetical protein